MGLMCPIGLISPIGPVDLPRGRGAAVGHARRDELRQHRVQVVAGADHDVIDADAGQAAAYFDQGGPVRMLRIGGTDYIAVTGCMPNSCDTRRVLLLIEDGGSRLFARLDEGGFAHYYGYGSGGVMKDTAPRIVDSGFNALYYRSGSAYPGPRS